MYLRWGADFPRFSRRLVPLTGFFPIVAIVNHNLDGRSLVDYQGPDDVWGSIVVMSPLYAAAALGFLSFLRSPRLAMPAGSGLPLGLLSVYAGACLLALPWAHDGAWSLSALLWSMPVFFIACLAGLTSEIEEWANETGYLLAFLGMAAINVGLVAIGLATGRAESLMGARNFGSVYASNSMIAVTMLIGPFAFLQARRSWAALAAFGLAALVVAAVSLSRSALFVIALLAVLCLWGCYRGEGRRLGLAGLALVPVIWLATVALSGFVADTGLGEVWLSRFMDPERGGSRIEAALAKRSEIFSDDLSRALDSPLAGRGFGSVAETSLAGFTDLHNLTYTELYENGGLAAAALIAVLLAAVVVGLLSPGLTATLPLMAGFVLWLALAHTTGSTLALRSPGGYNTPLHGTLVFLIVGAVFRGASTAFARRRTESA
jgi:hypothetical protein